jgi:hypothetical protein
MEPILRRRPRPRPLRSARQRVPTCSGDDRGDRHGAARRGQDGDADGAQRRARRRRVLRERIRAREPAGWSGLERLLDEAAALRAPLAALAGVGVAADSARTPLAAIVARIRAARPGVLS